MQDAYIIGGRRTPFVKSFGKFSGLRNLDLAGAASRELVKAFDLTGSELGDFALGAVIKSASDYNLAREVVLSSGLAPTTPGYDLQRACGTGLEALIQISNKIRLKQIDCGVGGGTDTNSDPPVQFSRAGVKKLLAFRTARSLKEKVSAGISLRPSDLFPIVMSVREARTGLSMGEHCERMAKQWSISRSDQDVMALVSHQSGAKAYREGFYRDWVVNINGVIEDAILRSDTSLEALKKLPPVFDEQGTLTAGNSTPRTDGAGVTLIASENFTKQKGWKPLARVMDSESAAVDFVGGEGLLMAPTVAVSRLLKRNELSFKDLECFEIHEAFAAQVLCTLRAWESAEYCSNRLKLGNPLGAIDLTKMNIKGGSLALGHPFAATGSRQATTLALLLSGKKGALGLATACTAGGMGVAVLLEGCA